MRTVSRLCNRGETMRMPAIGFGETRPLEYETDATMVFTLKCVAHIAEPRLRIRLILQNSTATPSP